MSSNLNPLMQDRAVPSACLRGAHLQVIAAPLQRLQAEIARGVDFAVLCNQHLANSLFPRDARQCQLQLPVPAINWLPAALHAAAQGCCCCLLCSVHVVLTSQRISPVVTGRCQLSGFGTTLDLHAYVRESSLLGVVSERSHGQLQNALSVRSAHLRRRCASGID